MKITKCDEAISLIQEEYHKAVKKFKPMNSAHEGKAVIEEELEELWDLIKRNRSKKEMLPEAVQVGAMAVRFIIDICKREE